MERAQDIAAASVAHVRSIATAAGAVEHSSVRHLTRHGAPRAAQRRKSWLCGRVRLRILMRQLHVQHRVLQGWAAIAVWRAFEPWHCVQVRGLTEARLLAGIHPVRVHSAAELSAAVAELPAYLACHPQVIGSSAGDLLLHRSGHRSLACKCAAMHMLMSSASRSHSAPSQSRTAKHRRLSNALRTQRLVLNTCVPAHVRINQTTFGTRQQHRRPEWYAGRRCGW